jgi:hypothetical protein
MHTDADLEQLGEVLRRTWLLHERELDPELILVWSDALAEYSVEDIAAGIARHMRDPDGGRYVPKPADVIAHLAGGSSIRSLRAWSTVEKAIRLVGHYQSVCFDDEVTHRVIDEMGGWPKLALTATLKDLEFRGVEFQKRYQGAMLTGGVGDDYPAYLPGEAETHNGAMGRTLPVLIGDVAKCDQVMARGRGGVSLRVTSAASVQSIAKSAVKRLEGGRA